jgi:hypothetical protein
VRYALSPYIKQICFVFKRLIKKGKLGKYTNGHRYMCLSRIVRRIVCYKQIPLKSGRELADCIRLAKVKGKWRAVVNMVMNFRFAFNEGNVLTS